MATLKTLTVTGSPADGATVTNTNTNTTPSIGSGATFQFQSSVAMTKSYGLKMVQTSTGQVFFYMDLASAVTTVIAGIVPFRFEAAPSVGATILRFYPDTAHATNLGNFILNTNRRLQFLEAGTGSPLNVTSGSGVPLAAATDYILMWKLNLTTNAMEASAYARGSSSPLFTISGTLGADMAAASGIQSLRWGIGTASTTLTLSTNDGFAIADTDYPDRYDLSGPPTIDVDQPADNIVDLRASTAYAGQSPLTYPTPVNVSGPTLTATSLASGLWMFSQDSTTDAVYTMKVQQADAQQATQNVTIPHLTTENQNAPLRATGANPGTGWD